MPIALLLIRIIETLFFVVIFTINYLPDGSTQQSLGILGLSFNFSIASSGSEIVISTLLIGFIFSLAGSLLRRPKAKSALWKWSLALSLLGLVGYLNEIGRLFAGYEFQFLISFPVVLLVIDWVLFARIKRELNHQVNDQENVTT